MTSLLALGPFTHHTAAAKGMTARQLAALCETGELIRPSRGLYLPAELADDISARAESLALVLPSGAAVARETAAWLLGIDVRPPWRWTSPPLLECLVPLGAARPRRPDISSFISDVPSDDLITIDGVPCTSPVRTAIDLARYRPRFIGLGTVDAFTHAGLMDIPDLERALRPLAGHRYIRRARDVIALCEPRTESQGESWTRLRVVEGGLPRPTVQVSLRDHSGAEAYRLDMGIEEGKVGIEYDGVEHHLRTPAQREHDDARRADIEVRFGWRTVVATAADIFGDRPVLEGTIMEMLGISFEIRRQPWGLDAREYLYSRRG